MLYNKWLTNLGTRYAAMLDGIAAEYNFDLGDEFELVLVHFLRRVLPGRCGVCRGHVVPAEGKPVGDDIIVFDRSRFPTLRGLQGDLSLKEWIPAEAVLAYIEAKHTLDKATLVKGIEQLAAVKRTPRVPVSWNELGDGIELGATIAVSQPGAGWPTIRNPWYTGLFARRTKLTAGSLQALLQEHVAAPDQIPEVITAGGLLVVPCIYRPNDQQELRPFIADGVASAFCDVGERSLALAVSHLLWAIQRIVTAEVPWQRVFDAQTSDVRPEVLRWFTGGSQNT